MTAHRIFVSLLGFLALAACASTAVTQQENESAAAAPQGDTIMQLSPRDLNPGECALFLFTRDTPRRFVLFSRAASNQASIMLENEEVTLPLTAAGGDILGQFLTRQTFSNGSETINLTLTPGDVIEDGQRIPVASLTRSVPDGWDVITPLQGVRACQPEKSAN